VFWALLTGAEGLVFLQLIAVNTANTAKLITTTDTNTFFISNLLFY
jgi:hypothetical protein